MIDANEQRPQRNARGDAAQQTQVDCLHHLVASARISGIAIICGAVLIAYWLHGQASPWAILAWLAAMILSGCARLAYIGWFRRAFEEVDAARWERRYGTLTGLTGFGWGALPWLPINPGPNDLFVIVVLMFCILLASASQLMASRFALISLTLTMLAPLLARLPMLEFKLAIVLFLGMLMVTAVMTMAVRAQRRLLLNALLNRHESGELLRQQKVIFESAGEGIVFLKPRPEYVVSCNRRFAEMLGYPLEAIHGMPPWQWHPSRERWKALVLDSLPTLISGRSHQAVLELQRADGSRFWGKITGMAVAGSDLSEGTVWVISDITEKRQSEAALQTSEARFRDLVNLSSDLYWEQDRHFRFTHFDGAESLQHVLPIKRLLGRTRWEASDIKGVQSERWAEHIATLQRHEPFHDFAYQIDGADGSRMWLSVSGNPLFDEKGEFIGYHGTATDISLRVEAEQRYRHLAYHDTLTQLPNRRLLVDRLEQAMRSAARRGSRVALLLLDLDGFKQVNDRHGHAAGDRVLEAVAGRLRGATREADTVARMGGDEFVILLPEIMEAEDAVRVADKIHSAVTTPIEDGCHAHVVGTSIGISIFPDHGETADALLHRADHAMYHGKTSGGKTTRLFDASSLN